MRLEDVPKKIATVGYPTANITQLAINIAYVLGESGCVTHYEPILCDARSGRVLYQQPNGEAVDFPSRMTPDMMAADLLRLSGEGGARYPPDELPGQKMGWHVHYAIISGQRVVIVWAAWADA